MCPRVQDQGTGTSPGGTGVSPCAGSGRGNQSWRHRCVPVCRVRAQEPILEAQVCPRVQGQGAGTRPGWHSVSPCAGSGRRNQAMLAQCVPVCRVRAQEPVLEAQVCPRVQGQGAGTRPGWHSVSPCAGSGHGNQSWRHNVSPCAGSGRGNQSWRHRCVPVCRVRAQEPVLEAQVCPCVQGQGAGTWPGWHSVSPCAGSGRGNQAGLAQCVPVCRVRAQEAVLEAQVCPRVQGQGAGIRPGWHSVSPCAGSGHRNQSWRHMCVPVCRVRALEPGRAGTVCPRVQGQGAETSPEGTGASPCAGSGRRNQSWRHRCVPVYRVRAQEPVLEAQVCPRVQGQGAGTSPGGTGVSPCAGSGRGNQSWRHRCVPVCRVRAREPGRAGTVCPHVQGQGAETSPGGTGVSPCAGSGRRNQSWRHRCVPVSGSGCRNQAGVAQCVPVCRVRAREPGQAGTDCPRVQGQGAGTGSVHGCPLHGDEESRHRAGRRGWNAQGGRT
ncbi:uncharacterized protein LOC125754791 isoform X5 [Canis lupus dingo]|uniref:uncharacterized protein LOC125754791 isoform X5 n=2 Tax=Canis lupus dingo TaxID=286419 RepID=UPI0020C1BC0D|nr:uncharacterized protein LOC125754791 isoform X5 [Canis lupus dingo]